MEDREIVRLYHNRAESAIAVTAAKYGTYCHSIAFRILGNDEDAEECVSDTYFKAWNAMPPDDPPSLKGYLGKITRRLACHVLEKQRSKKRGEGEVSLVFDELSECIPSAMTTERAVEQHRLTAIIEQFVKTLSVTQRQVFLRRYWYAQSVQAIAKQTKLSESHVKVTLHRTRNKLKAALSKEGVTI